MNLRHLVVSAILLCSASAFADVIHLDDGNSITIGDTTIICGTGSSMQCVSATDNPYVKCLQSGYSPSTCSVLDNGCNGGQIQCLTQGYSPSTCGSITAKSPGVIGRFREKSCLPL